MTENVLGLEELNCDDLIIAGRSLRRQLVEPAKATLTIIETPAGVEMRLDLELFLKSGSEWIATFKAPNPFSEELTIIDREAGQSLSFDGFFRPRSGKRARRGVAWRVKLKTSRLLNDEEKIALMASDIKA